VQLNRAITHGAEKGYFVLPKGILFNITEKRMLRPSVALFVGPSGKVKLPPKRSSDSSAAKEVTIRRIQLSTLESELNPIIESEQAR
jgi:hypothetical protein